MGQWACCIIITEEELCANLHRFVVLGWKIFTVNCKDGSPFQPGGKSKIDEAPLISHNFD